MITRAARVSIGRPHTDDVRMASRFEVTPTDTPSGPVYEVSDGGMNLLPGKDVMPLVARDGIEPPTPAFSGMSDQQLTGNPYRKHKTYSITIWTPFGLQGVFG